MSFPTRGIIPRFDNIKVIKSYLIGETQEHLFIAGHITRDTIVGSDTQYIPEVFVSRLELNPGGNISNIWYSIINSRLIKYSTNDQVVPCDLVFDVNSNIVAVINSSTEMATFASSKAHLLLVEASYGNPIKFYSYEGPSLINGVSIHDFYGQTIHIKTNGKYCINGWVDNYSLASSYNNRYNFYQVDFDPNILMFDSLKFLLGTSKAYLSTQPRDFYGIFTDTGYSEGAVFVSLGPYWTHHTMIVYVDSNGITNETVCWISTESNDTLNHQLRIWSSKFGQGNNGLMACEMYKVETIQGEELYDIIPKSPNLQFVPCVEYLNGSFTTNIINFDKEVCNGYYD